MVIAKLILIGNCSLLNWQITVMGTLQKTLRKARFSFLFHQSQTSKAEVSVIQTEPPLVTPDRKNSVIVVLLQ